MKEGEYMMHSVYVQDVTVYKICPYKLKFETCLLGEAADRCMMYLCFKPPRDLGMGRG